MASVLKHKRREVIQMASATELLVRIPHSALVHTFENGLDITLEPGDMEKFKRYIGTYVLGLSHDEALQAVMQDRIKFWCKLIPIEEGGEEENA